MIEALVERWKRELSAVPPYLSWLTECDPDVLRTYLLWKRTLVIRGIPIIIGCLLIQSFVEHARILKVGNPLSMSLYIICVGTLAWPPAYASLGAAFSRAAASPSKFAARLRVWSIAFFGLAVLCSICLASLTIVALYAWFHAVASI
jgi:hypothetical protein